MNILKFCFRQCKEKVVFHLLRRGGNFGWCPICEKRTLFYREGQWLRDQYRCIRCRSIPRWRALIFVLESYFSKWRELRIHESSPGGASSNKLARECHHYIRTYCFDHTEPGKLYKSHRCENLEQLTFPDESFDIVVTQDVMEHVLDPKRAFSEIFRTLKPQGVHVFSIPWYYWKDTVVRAVPNGDKIDYLHDPVYHKNPIDQKGSLVVTEWGWDLCDIIFRCTGMTTTVFRIVDPQLGIKGKFIEIFVSGKR